MAKLTRRQERRLEITGNVVRMFIAVITFVFPLLCVMKANDHYVDIVRSAGVPEIPRAATYGTILGIYLPLFAAVAAYVWATRPVRKRNAAPHGFAMALFRDFFTILVVTVLLFIPVLMYGLDERIQTVNTYLVWYQTIVTAGAGAAFAYYFHASISPNAATPADGVPAAEETVPSAPARRRRTPRKERSPAPES
jgi:hypothetical protein